LKKNWNFHVFTQEQTSQALSLTSSFNPKRPFPVHYWNLTKADKANYRAHGTFSVKFPDGTCQQIKQFVFFAGRYNLERYVV